MAELKVGQYVKFKDPPQFGGTIFEVCSPPAGQPVIYAHVSL